jgi:hypothetical protein
MYLIPCTQLQRNRFPDGCRRAIRPWLIPPFLSKLGPFLPLSDCVLYDRFLKRALDAPRNLCYNEE